MDKFSINNILKIKALHNEYELERAASLFLRLRNNENIKSSYASIRSHLSILIEAYEQSHWEDESSISDNQLMESDMAELLVQDENIFIQKRKYLIKDNLKNFDLNQNDLANILGHSKSYMSELINGLRPFSKEDIIILNRLMKISLKDLLPPFIKHDKAKKVNTALRAILSNNTRLSEMNFFL